MSADIVIITSSSVAHLRRKAKELKKKTGIPHHEALDQVARESKRFRDWYHLMEHANATLPTEQAFKSGLIVGMDRKDVDFDLSRLAHFLPDVRVSSFLSSEFMKLHPKPWSDELEYDWEDIDDLEYFRPLRAFPNTLDEVLELCRKDFFFLPRYIRLKGKVIDLFLEKGIDNV
jgi:hypothetical protein